MKIVILAWKTSVLLASKVSYFVPFSLQYGLATFARCVTTFSSSSLKSFNPIDTMAWFFVPWEIRVGLWTVIFDKPWSEIWKNFRLDEIIRFSAGVFPFAPVTPTSKEPSTGDRSCSWIRKFCYNLWLISLSWLFFENDSR